MLVVQARTQGSDIEKFQRAGIPVKMDADAAHMHHKVSCVHVSWYECFVLAWSDPAAVSDVVCPAAVTH